MERDQELMKALIAKLYEVLTGGDYEQAEKDTDNFIAWVPGGLPYQPQELRFASRGFQGEGATEEERARDSQLLYLQAADFAELMNKVPETEGVWQTSSASIPDVYGSVLRFSEVASGELTPEQEKAIERFRGLLTVTKEEEDIITGEKVTKVEDSPMIKAYKQKQAAYVATAIALNNKLVAAQNADNEADVHDWARNGHLYQMQVQAAMDDWVANGYKNEVDKINAFLDQVTQRDLTLWKRSLQQRYDNIITDPTSTRQFRWTSLIPAAFAEDTQGWTKFEFSESMVDTYAHKEGNSWGAEGGASFGLFGAKASASGSSTSTEHSLDTSNFSMSFWFTQAVLSRPWFDPQFLESKAWRFAGAAPQAPLSDGQIPPHGQMVAYPTRAVFVRDLTVDFAELHNEGSEFTKEFKAGGSVSYGPFSVGGNYSRSEEEQKFHSEQTDAGVSVTGMQIVGFMCHVLDKAPNPSEEVESWK